MKDIKKQIESYYGLSEAALYEILIQSRRGIHANKSKETWYITPQTP